MKQLTEHPLPGSLPAGFFSALVHRVEDALTANSDAPVRELSDTLGADLAARLRACPQDVRAAVVGHADASEALRMAFELGQLAFAQHLVATVAASRPDPAFYTAYDNPELKPCIECLFEEDVNSVALADALGLSQADLVDVLNTLRALGIADFRKWGPDTVNFLTPTGRAYAQMREDERDAEEDLHG